MLSIDVEGAELDVLESGNLMVRRPKLLAVESWNLPWEPENKVTNFLKANSYALVAYSGLTAFYSPDENLMSLTKDDF